MYTDYDPSSIPMSPDDNGRLYLTVFLTEEDAKFFASFSNCYDNIKHDNFIKKIYSNIQIIILVRKDIIVANNITDVHDLAEYYLNIDDIEIDNLNGSMFYIEDTYSSSLVSLFNGSNNKLNWCVFNTKEDAQYTINIIRNTRNIDTSNYKICPLGSEPIDFGNTTPVLVSKK